jgi:hypothetical protein
MDDAMTALAFRAERDVDAASALLVAAYEQQHETYLARAAKALRAGTVVLELLEGTVAPADRSVIRALLPPPAGR